MKKLIKRVIQKGIGWYVDPIYRKITEAMPYLSLQVEGITYFYNHVDQVIPNYMKLSGTNWAKDDIEKFIHIADKLFYRNKSAASVPHSATSVPPETGIFLDIGGNIGTTSIYCKLKLKPEMHFIGFEPVKDNATVFKINTIINGIDRDVTVEEIALSNENTGNRVIAILPENMGGSGIVKQESLMTVYEQEGRTFESIHETTLDDYLSVNQISGDQIKYIWIDVEGYEPHVLEGAANLFKNYRIPTCIEFNWEHYKSVQSYEKMIKLLEQYFDYFIVCQQVSSGEPIPRQISEIGKLCEELNRGTCDLILF